MSNLRIIGLIISLFGLFLTFIIFRGPKWERRNFIFFGVLSLFLMIISINPNVLNIIAEILKLETKQRGRILALLIGSNIFLWFALLYLKTKLDKYRYQFDLLVRNLGREEVKHVLKEGIADKQIIVIIPAYNEAQNLKELLPKIPTKIEGMQVGVLVVDDGSTDETVQAVKEAGCLVVRNNITRGGGAALRLGYDILKNIKPEIVITMDADGQHHPQEIERLVKPILQGTYDFVLGSRILGEWERDNRFRFIGLNVFNLIINLLLGTKITDCSSGFRAFKVDLLKAVTLREDQYHTSELIIDAAKKGARIGEAPITILKRSYGKSKKGKDWKYGLSFAKTILNTRWR